MSSMTIPEPAQIGAAKLKNLTESQSQDLLAAVKKSKPEVGSRGLTKQVTDQVNSVPKQDIRDILRTVLSFYRFRQTFDLSLENTVDEIVMSDSLKHLKLSERQQKSFRSRLAAFLDDIDSLFVSAKALGLLYAREHVLTDVKVLTDVRPVFSNSAVDTPVAAMVTHTMVITYMENSKSEPREMFVAFDAKDMASLRRALASAESKAKGIKKMLKNAKVNYLEESNEVLG